MTAAGAPSASRFGFPQICANGNTAQWGECRGWGWGKVGWRQVGVGVTVGGRTPRFVEEGVQSCPQASERGGSERFITVSEWKGEKGGRHGRWRVRTAQTVIPASFSYVQCRHAHDAIVKSRLRESAGSSNYRTVQYSPVLYGTKESAPSLGLDFLPWGIKVSGDLQCGGLSPTEQDGGWGSRKARSIHYSLMHGMGLRI